MKGKDEMSNTEKKLVEDAIETFKALPLEDQKALLRIGKDMIFINAVKNECK